MHGEMAINGFEWEAEQPEEDADSWVLNPAWELSQTEGSIWLNMGEGRHCVKAEDMGDGRHCGKSMSVSYSPLADGAKQPSFAPPLESCSPAALTAIAALEAQLPALQPCSPAAPGAHTPRGTVGHAAVGVPQRGPMIGALRRRASGASTGSGSQAQASKAAAGSGSQAQASVAAASSSTAYGSQAQASSAATSSSTVSGSRAQASSAASDSQAQASAASSSESSAAIETDMYPDWAVSNKKKAKLERDAHLANNQNQAVDRGTYVVDEKTGEKFFVANTEYGGQIYMAGMGRQRVRKRGRGGGNKGFNDGWDGGGGGGGRGRGGGSSMDQVSSALQTMGVMAQSTATLVEAFVTMPETRCKIEPKLEPKSEPADTEPKAEQDYEWHSDDWYSDGWRSDNRHDWHSDKWSAQRKWR